MQVGVGCLTAMGAITRLVYGAAATRSTLRETVVAPTRHTTMMVSAHYRAAFPKIPVSTGLCCECGGTCTEGGRECRCTLGIMLANPALE